MKLLWDSFVASEYLLQEKTDSLYSWIMLLWKAFALLLLCQVI
jgi:hypothetical protein